MTYPRASALFNSISSLDALLRETPAATLRKQHHAHVTLAPCQASSFLEIYVDLLSASDCEKDRLVLGPVLPRKLFEQRAQVHTGLHTNTLQSSWTKVHPSQYRPQYEVMLDAYAS